MDHMGVCSLIYLWFRNLLIWWNNGVVHQVSQLRNVGNKGAVAYLGAREICSVGGIAAMGVFGCWSGCDGDATKVPERRRPTATAGRDCRGISLGEEIEAGTYKQVLLGHQGTPSVTYSDDGAISSPPASYHLLPQTLACRRRSSHDWRTILLEPSLMGRVLSWRMLRRTIGLGP
jgi:hypothetical protein